MPCRIDTYVLLPEWFIEAMRSSSTSPNAETVVQASDGRERAGLSHSMHTCGFMYKVVPGLDLMSIGHQEVTA